MDAPTRSSNDTEARAEPRTHPGPIAPPPWAEADGYHFDHLVRRTPATDVYLAVFRPAGTWREVVVVRPLPGVDQAALRRAVDAEVSAAGTLVPPGAAPVVDVGCTRDGRLYVATVRPAGRSLGEMVAEAGAMPAKRALGLGLAMSRILAVAHDAGLVHGWLTPDSVVVVPKQDNQPERVVVLGFGTAAAQDGRPEPAPFPAQLYPYAGPERADGGPATAQSDVFSLGSVILSLLTGGAPPAAGATGSVELGTTTPEVEAIGQVLVRARATDPRKRYASAAALADALSAAGGAPTQGSSAARLPARRRPAAVSMSDAAGVPLGLPVPGAVRTDDQSPSDGRRVRRGVLVGAGVAAVVAAGAGLAWRTRTASDAVPPLAEAARTAEPTPPPPPSPPPAAVPDPVQASAIAVGPPPVPEQPALPSGPAPVVSRTPEQDAPALPPPRVDVRTPPAASPVPARTAPQVAAAPVRDPAPTARRPSATAAPVAQPATAPVASRTDNGRTAQTAPATGSATGDVVTAAPSREAGPVGGASGIRPGAGSPTPSNASTDAVTASDAAAGGAVAAITAASTAAGVRAVVAEYATAVQARDIGWLRRIYPDMTEQQRSAWVAFFGSVDNLRTRLAVGDIAPAGAAVRVRVLGTYEYQNLRPRRAERLPVSFTATVARDASGWRVRAVE